MIAGFFQLILGLLKLGAIANYFPSSVIKGMLAAIGIILISKQIPLLLGYDQPDFWTSGFLHLFSSKNILGNLSSLHEHVSATAIWITLFSLIIMILQSDKEWVKRIKMIPAPLLVVILGIAINFIFTSAFPNHALTSSQLVNIPQNMFASISFPDFTKLFSSTSIWEKGILVGLLATLETLLCVEAVDKLDKHNRITPVNRELIAQGVGNLCCGMLGAIPITAVVVRGSANVDAGGRSKLSAFTHGLFLLLAVLLIPTLLNKIPYASLAVILFVTGLNLTKPKLYKNMWSLGWKQFLPFLITIMVILSTDLLIGVSIGLLVSIYFIVQNNFKAEYKITKKVHHDIETHSIKLNSNVTFLNKVKLRKALDEIPEYSVLHIDGNESNFIDYDILEIISEFHTKAHDRHIEVKLSGIEKVNVDAVH